jgi:IS605 OrfB family transposase
MKITSSYKVACVKAGRITFQKTADIYQEAVSYLTGVYEEEWPVLSSIGKAPARKTAAERLVHSTENNIAKYDFDVRFPKFPSYLRRAAIAAALGAVSSYHSNYSNWVAGGCKGNAPKLTAKHNKLPCFYKENMSLWDDYAPEISLKLYTGSDWVWVSIKLRVTDVKYLKRYWHHVEPSAPTLERHYGKYYLRFAFKEDANLYDVNLVNGRICAVDLGLNTDAVCCILQPDGTVVARKFIDFPAEKDQLWRVLNRIRRKQREHGPQSVKDIWNYAKYLNDELARKIAAAITDFAVLHSAETMVFEYLDFKGKRGRGSKKQRLHMWRRNSIQECAAHKAHRCGIHVAHICPWGTSALAFDGSGKLQRNKDNHALAVFQGGKQYNCDLSASYNIGARYYVRELMKTLSESERSQLTAEDREFGRRTSTTLSTLWKLYPKWLELYKGMPAESVQPA